MRPLASRLADKTSLSTYHVAYDTENKRMSAPVHEPTGLIPPIRKHTFAPDIDPSNLIDDEAVFRALTGINWATPDFQPMDKQGVGYKSRNSMLFLKALQYPDFMIFVHPVFVVRYLTV